MWVGRKVGKIDRYLVEEPDRTGRVSCSNTKRIRSLGKEETWQTSYRLTIYTYIHTYNNYSIKYLCIQKLKYEIWVYFSSAIPLTLESRRYSSWPWDFRVNSSKKNVLVVPTSRNVKSWLKLYIMGELPSCCWYFPTRIWTVGDNLATLLISICIVHTRIRKDSFIIN